jgi:hypothetical protein
LQKQGLWDEKRLGSVELCVRNCDHFPVGNGVTVAAQEAGVRTAAEELDKRSKPAEDAGGGQKGKLSDRSVNVMTTLAFSIMPEEYPGPDGKPVKVNKSNPNKYLIPIDDARRIIRVATRSAYAEACGLIELERANYEAMMKNEEARKTWSSDQLMFIRALHVFSVSYFTGSMEIKTTEEDNDVRPAQTAADLEAKEKSGAASQKSPVPKDEAKAQVFAPKKLECPPDQKVKVEKSITAYVQAAPASVPKAPKPAAPAAPSASEAPKSAPAMPEMPPPPATGAN